MELRQLEYFVTVAEERHFAKAAGRMHVAQPSVNQQIKELEREPGLALFERRSRAVSLTPGDSELLPLAARLLADARRRRELRRAVDDGSPSVGDWSTGHPGRGQLRERP